MNKSLTAWGLCALMSAGSILFANEAPVQTEKKPELETVVSINDTIKPPRRFAHRRNDRFFPPRKMHEFKCRAQIPGADHGRKNFQPMRRGFRHGPDGGPFFMARQNRRFDIIRQLLPKAPMNEDEMAIFSSLKADLRDALETYREENTKANDAALRASVDKLVTAAQQHEIDRCEKALARAKAAVAVKDKIVERTIKKLTRQPRLKAGLPPGFRAAK